ncbi:type VI secretion system contractile sheath large subunit [Mesorhizobium sp. RP14(2022)]|uniref:Type VI secretion system contractile sheath large subunit n=1 Tax=Mesorhizobium liriopis TaxID=2953882 RepID=A0ABT1CAE6_9HYPH|nr:type VI secretion system contractile sheath large subunit [Mesorhizobium liriopis]MCO6051757.1 type VI secretion system contractile sheath large subunit [Mesorhizobium liriopis]
MNRPSSAPQEDAFLRADRLVALIDDALSKQTSRIIQHPQFQSMEARWRGLALLLRASRNAPEVKIKILSIGWTEFSRAMERATEFDQSRLFELVYSQEFGMPGGEPFGMLVGDYEIGHLPDGEGRDPVGTLSAVASVAAAAFCPFVAGASPRLLQIDNFAELSRLPDLSRLLLDNGLFRWKRLRAREDTRFVGLVAPRILLRGPYDPDTRLRIDGFRFREDTTSDGSHLLWGNGAFAFASVAIRRFLQSGWFADLRGAPQDEEGGGLVSALAPFELGLESQGLSAQAPVEVRLTSLQEQQISELGLVPISTNYLSSTAVFNSNQSLHEPQNYANQHATQNARLSAMLQYVLCASRFAHYLKVILREEVGRLADRNSIQRKLDNWLSNYTLGNDDADADMRSRFPLRLAQVSVEELAGRAGAFACAVRLQPHFQLDDVATSFHLLAETGTLGGAAPARASA